MLLGLLSIPGACADTPDSDVPNPAPVTRVQGPAGALYIDDGGSGGLPVVLVHSYAGSTTHWAAQLAHLRTGRRAIALDLRGHGQSAAPADGDYAVAALARDIAAVVDSLGIDRFVLVGHSLGGSAAGEYAGANPGRIAGLVLVGAPGQSSPEEARPIMASLESNYDTVMAGYWNTLLTDARPEVRTRLTSEMQSVPKDASLKLISAIFAYDPLPAIRRYPGPKLLVVTPHGNTPKDLQNLMPEVPHRVMTGTSHWPHMDKPEEFNRLLDEFLAGLP
ncbi:MAG TPA: alpha/beta fold hydrolase [Gemmatimonadales bacterium]|jgi:pimeloyl-ACP methyl ester carboxylesterase|nr:alpha/beta fold hydrolase [Gemmatimonadales bacterium]